MVEWGKELKEEKIRFGEQAEKMIAQLADPEKAKEKLIKLAKQRSILISGGDVMKYIIKGRILTSIDGDGVQ